MAKKTTDITAPTGDLAEALVRKAGQTEFDTIPTGIDGISLRHEKDRIPDITTQMAGRLAVSASEYVGRKRQIDDLTSLQTISEGELKQAASKYRGLRGFDSDLANSRLSITPRLKIEWDRQVLQRQLGIHYTAIVHERLMASVAVPLGLETDEGPLSSELLEMALRRGLATLGLGREAAGSMIATTVEAEVDESELASMLGDGRLAELPDNVATLTETWSISVNPLHKT